jgi:putative sterol carrier protein
MSDIVDAALTALTERFGQGGFQGGSVRFVIEGEGAIRVDESGVARDDDGAANCTITAEADTFRSMFDGDLNPTAAFMSGKLTIDGDMGTAMRVASAFA